MKTTILPFPVCCCAPVTVIMVSLGAVYSGLSVYTGPRCGGLALTQIATRCRSSGAGVFGYVKERLEQVVFSFRRFLPSQNTQGGWGYVQTELFSWSLSCEAEPCCEGTGYLQLKCV